MTAPLTDQRLDEILARAADVDCPDCGVRDEELRQLGDVDVPDLIAEIRRLRAENEQLADLDAAAGRRAELQAERDRAVQWWHDEHKRAGKAEAERDDLRERIGNARMEIAAQSAARHVAACGSPVGSVVDRALAKVETHLVDRQHRPAAVPGGVEHSAENPPKSDYSSTTFERTEP